MNRFVRSLAEICGASVADEKWLLAPSLRVGNQWLDAVSRVGRPALNVRVKTLRGMALELAAPQLAEKGLAPAGDAACEILFDRIWTRRRAAGGGYLASLPASFALTRAISRSLRSLRLAGLDPGRLRPGRFEVGEKGAEIRDLLEELTASLRARRWADPAEILAIAVSRLRAGGSGAEGWILLVPSDLEAAGLDAALLAEVPPGRVRTLAVDEPDAARLVPLGPAGGEELQVEVTRAIGEVNEVRDAFRRCLARSWPLDQVEILHTDDATYVPLIHQTAARLSTGGGPLAAGIPVTFAEGLPSSVTRPGRALAGWLRWIAEDFPQAALVGMVREGLIRVPEGGAGASDASRLGTRLRRIPIGWGRDRYQPAFDAERAALRARAERPDDRGGDEDAAAPGALAARRRAQESDLDRLRTLALGLLAVSPRAGAPDAAWLDAARAFLADHAGGANEIDNLARDRLLGEIAFLRETLAAAPGEGSLDPREWLAALPGETRVGGSGPRPGSVHVDHVARGGHTGRPHTIILGLDDGRFPGSIREDPVLLDAERRSISRELPVASDLLRRRLESYRRLVARLRGSATLSFPCRSLEDDREQFPSAVILDAFRTLSGNAAGDHGDLSRWLGPPASFAPERAESCLDETDWWFWRQEFAGDAAGTRDAVIRRFPHLGRGLAARGARSGDLFTEYDGAVPAAGAAHDATRPGGPVVSARRLETIGACPLRYFFRHALGVEPLDEIVLDPECWLDPRESGQLLHDLFYEFWSELAPSGRAPSVARDRARLDQILDALIARYREIQPPPSASVFEREVRLLRRAALIFLSSEAEEGAASRPEFLEVTVGSPAFGRGTALDSEEPAVFPLGRGRAVRVRGRVDRVDRAADGAGPRFVVWDYKTGSPKPFLQPDPFRQGRAVQHALYASLIGGRLRAAIDPASSVAAFGYLFPSAKGLGARRTYSPEELAAGGSVVGHLCEIAAGGAFLATDDADDCARCDFARVCGDLPATAAASKRKLDRAENEPLAPMRALRREEGSAAT